VDKRRKRGRIILTGVKRGKTDDEERQILRRRGFSSICNGGEYFPKKVPVHSYGKLLRSENGRKDKKKKEFQK